jgi:hypothetical protein
MNSNGHVNRCGFRTIVAVAALCLIGSITRGDSEPVEIVPGVAIDLPQVASVVRLTAPPLHHFVGYYGITPWNASGDKLFCLQSAFGDRLVAPGDMASVCLIDPSSQKLTRIAETSAWNLQQGAMLHWMPTSPDREIIYNDRIDGRLVSVILDIENKKRRIIDRPVAAISNSGKMAIALDYDRLRRIRPVTGYAGGDPNTPLVNRPADNGLFLIDLASGKSRLLVSVEACSRLSAPPETLKNQPFWLEHAMFSRDDERVFLLARAFDPKTRQLVSLPLTISPDGTGLKALMPWAIQGASHYDWLDGRRLILTREHAPTKWHHLLLNVDRDEAPTVLAPDVLTRDGHCSVSPDGKWMITDTYPDENRRQHLFVLNVRTGVAGRIASFAASKDVRGDWRCDLHPRWSRDSKSICIDSTHEGARQVYAVELKMPGS